MATAGRGRRRTFRTLTLTVTLPLTLFLALTRSATDRVSQLTVLLYLNDDFEGGETVLYPGQHEDERPTEGGVSVSVRPATGSILCFGQTFKFNRARVPQPVQEVQEGLGAPCRGRSAIEIASRSPGDRTPYASAPRLAAIGATLLEGSRRGAASAPLHCASVRTRSAAGRSHHARAAVLPPNTHTRAPPRTFPRGT